MLVHMRTLFLLAATACIAGCQADELNGKQDSKIEYTASQPGAFNRHADHLQYTKHAICRMDCRHVTPAEVQDMLLHGSINYEKTNLRDKPCATYALEGYTLSDHQHVRIIFAQCNRVTRVVTCIDLDHDFTCNCR